MCVCARVCVVRMCVCVCACAHARAHTRSHTHSCRRNAKWGQDQLDSIDFIGENSAAAFGAGSFSRKALTSVGARRILMKPGRPTRGRGSREPTQRAGYLAAAHR